MSKKPKDENTKSNKPDDLEKRIQELTEALKRERADAENMRRRQEEQISALKDIVKANIVRELLPVIDNFERSLKHIPKNLEKNDYAKGVQGIVNQFEETLSRMGVERIKTVGKVFDPVLHEAVAMDEGDGTVEIVSEELQAGYKLGEEIIRHAMVKVRMENSK